MFFQFKAGAKAPAFFRLLRRIKIEEATGVGVLIQVILR